MSKIVDFNHFRVGKEQNEIIEKKYLKFLAYVNKHLGIPTKFEKCVEVFYFAMRYLEGTINGLLIVGSLFADPKELKEFKKMAISWLEDILKNLKEI